MGFKCPSCRLDFGTDKHALIEHIKSNSNCLKKTGLINTMLYKTFRNYENTTKQFHNPPEQSKRLLELGVPADSADCYLIHDGIYLDDIRVRHTEYTLSKTFF